MMRLTCLVGSFLVSCFGARGGVLISEEAARGRFGSIVTTGVVVRGVDGREGIEVLEAPP